MKVIKYRFFLCVGVIFIIPHLTSGQGEAYTLTRTPFSTNQFHEFSPTWYRDKLVFCTDRNSGLKEYASSSNERYINLYLADTSMARKNKKVKPLSSELNSALNDGPATFSKEFDTVYLSRNLIVEGKQSELSYSRNKLGIFFSVNEGEGWSRLKEFRFNSEWFNITTPCITQDGKRLYFASDKPDGQGGSDLYYSEWKDGFWNNPVNLGPVVNTPGNEAYPFISSSGDLFFSSDGFNGLGGKDIYVTRFEDGTWLVPVALERPINSEAEDFGLITDSLMSAGYFSSSRGKTIDIYHFKTNIPQFFFPAKQKENGYCFEFRDKGTIEVNPLYLQKRWTFSDGSGEPGELVYHCFPGPGKYNVKLELVERSTQKVFFRKKEFIFEIQDADQPYIFGPEAAARGEEAEFDGLKSYTPGYRVLQYSWDFGDGKKAEGERVRHIYEEEGLFRIKLGLILISETDGSYSKRAVQRDFRVFNTALEKEVFLAQIDKQLQEIPAYDSSHNASVLTVYDADKQDMNGEVYRIILATSKSRKSKNSPEFRKLPRKYILREDFINEDSVFVYSVEQQMSLMHCYPSFSELFRAGFNDAEVGLFKIDDPAERELLDLIRNYGNSGSEYFDINDRLTTSGYIMLDQLVKLLNKYPTLKIEIGLHSDNSIPVNTSLNKTRIRAQVINDYLVNRGISANRLMPNGYGSTKPVTQNLNESERKQNWRIEFQVID